MKFNIEGDSSDNSNTHLSINENNPFTLIASYKEKNYIFMNKPIAMNCGQVEIVEIRRKFDEKKNTLIFKYLIVGKDYLYEKKNRPLEELGEIEDFAVNIAYNFFTLELV